jgi:excisionase family DNA binding protein
MTLLWSLEETAQQLGDVSVRTVRRLIERRQLEAVKIGRRCLVVPASVMALVEQQQQSRHNPRRAGDVLGGHSTCQKRTTAMVYVNEKARHTGGRVSPTPAADALAAVLGLPAARKPKPS